MDLFCDLESHFYSLYNAPAASAGQNTESTTASFIAVFLCVQF